MASVKELEEIVLELKEKLVEQNQVLEDLTSPPFYLGTVISINHKTVFVLTDSKMIEVILPQETVHLGDTVRLSPKTLAIVGITRAPNIGDMATVKESTNSNVCEIEHGGKSRLAVVRGSVKNLSSGDRVIVDPTASVILAKLDSGIREFSFVEDTQITWEDIGGLKDAKRELREAIELPFTHPEVFRFYRQKPTRGLLLFGPPGCGKTLLAKAATTALAKVHDRRSSSTGFIYVKGPAILDRYVGSAEATIRQLFDAARKHKSEFGYPAIIFIDEADAILSKRGTGISSDVEKTIVPMFLAEMDGLQESGSLMILATNRPDTLDPAVVRDGRIDRKIKISRPDRDTAKEIFKLALTGIPIAESCDPESMADLGVSEIFSSSHALYEIKTTDGAIPFTLGHLISGAMIAGIVKLAISRALNNSLEEDSPPRPITAEDLAAATKKTFEQNLELNHKDDLELFAEQLKDRMTGIKKLTQKTDE